MKKKNVVIAYASSHHKNTEKVAKAMAEACDAKLVNVLKLKEKEICVEDVDVLGIGTGIFAGKPHKGMVKFLENLPEGNGKEAFVFTTSTFMVKKYNRQIEKVLKKKGYKVLPGHKIKGWNTFGPFKLVGGVGKGRPNAADLYESQAYIAKLFKIK